MTEYRVGKAIVRVHGKAEREKIEEATAIFLKKVRRKRK